MGLSWSCWYRFSVESDVLEDAFSKSFRGPDPSVSAVISIYLPSTLLGFRLGVGDVGAGTIDGFTVSLSAIDVALESVGALRIKLLCLAQCGITSKNHVIHITRSALCAYGERCHKQEG